MSFIEDLFASIILLVSSKEVWNIVGLSIYVSISAVLLASLIGIPTGIILGSKKKQSLIISTVINTGMGLPPVVAGLVVYLIISNNGILGELNLMFTPLAMIIAQMILTFPIITGVTRNTIHSLPQNFNEFLLSLGASVEQRQYYLMVEAKRGIVIAIMLALGRAFSEVGAIIIVGGNIRYHTRVLTTSIITEISKGEIDMALALGIILLSISFTITLIMTYIQIKEKN